MQLILERGITIEKSKVLIERIRELGLRPFQIQDGEIQKIVLPETDESKTKQLDNFPGVEKLSRISTPYKLASRQVKLSDTIVNVNGVKIGGKQICMIAGPCAVESLDQTISVASELSKLGVKIFRGGAYKPRTSPYAFQGLREKGLEYLAEVKSQFGMNIITEVINSDSLKHIVEVADILQVGSRNMQNFDLLKEVGKANKPVLLKRGMSATIQDFLMSAEYIMAQGNNQVILCERGIRTFETATRNTLDLNAVPLLKQVTHLPVLVDPSHGTGIRELVAPMACAGVVAGAHGITVEVHCNPDEALSDGMQSLTPVQFKDLFENVKKIESVLM